MTERREAWQRLGRRRRRAVRLVEELGLRTQRIESQIKVLEDYSKRIDELKAKIAAHKAARGPADERRPWLSELRQILCITQETPTSIRNRCKYLGQVYTEYQWRSAACRKATCGWSSRSPKSTAIAA